MWTSWEDDIDGLRTWDELIDHLGEECRQVRDGDAGAVITTDVDELLVDEPPMGRARQRRALHKLGFRRTSDGCWSWTPSAGDLPPPSPRLPAFMAPAWTRVQRAEALDRARREMVVRVLREVYGCTPEQLIVTVVYDENLGEWEDDEAFPALDCAAIEDRFGHLRRAAD